MFSFIFFGFCFEVFGGWEIKNLRICIVGLFIEMVLKKEIIRGDIGIGYIVVWFFNFWNEEVMV